MPNRLSLRPGVAHRFSSFSGESRESASSGQASPAESFEPEQSSLQASESQHDRSRAAATTLSRANSQDRAIDLDKPASSTSRSPSLPGQQIPPPVSAPHGELEDLKTKLRIMERKRAEDREKLNKLERAQVERDKFEAIIQKLQSKYQPQQQNIVELKKQLREETLKYSDLEAQIAENEMVVELATLDREMAEETAESLKTELDTLRRKYEETELEVEILREENQELGKEMSPEEKTSQGWIQMERSNERLRDALMRLRDMTQQQEADLRAQISELEKDVHDLGNAKEDSLRTKEKLTQSESIIEDLRQQLDTALGAEEMIEELTEKNFSLNEQLENLKVAVEDLESLKEVNDELEINHTETEKQMQEEIEYHESLLTTELKKSAQKDETIQDLEYTMTRFRDLVTNMQNDLENMRASKQITETQANEMTNHSRAMMDLNIRLQASASKTQVKAIDLELRKLEAQESAEHLKIVQLFLPESFNSEKNSVLAFLAFKRIGFKANLLHGFIKERVNREILLDDSDVFVCYDILDRLVWVASTCKRFINYIETATVDAFQRLEGAIYELEPVERAFNGWIDALKTDELKEAQCATELQR